MRRVYGGFALAVVAFGGFLHVFDPSGISAELASASPLPMVVGLITVLFAVACWAESMRRILVASGGSLTRSRGFGAYAAGMFAKQILPMGNAGGVAIMAYAIDREAEIGLNRSLAVVTVGDFLGLLATLLLAFVGVGYAVLWVPPTRLLRVVLIGVGLFGAILLTLALLLVYRRRTLGYVVVGVARLLRGSVGRLSRRVADALSPALVEAGLSRYFDTFDAARGDRRSLLIAAALALTGWTLFAVPLYTSALAVGEHMPFGLVLFIVPAGGLATAVPLPGGIGGVEFAIGGMIVALTSIDLATVGAIVVLYRLCVYWFPILVGLGGVLYTATSVSTLAADATEWAEQVEETPSDN